MEIPQGSEQLKQSTDQSLPTAPADDSANQLSTPADAADTAESEVIQPREPADAAADSDTQGADECEFTDPADVVTALEVIARKDDADVDPLEAARLKRIYYTLQQSREKADFQDYLANGGNAEDYVAPLDPAADHVKELLNTIKEKKARERERLAAQLAANADRKRAITARLEEMSADADNVNLHWQEAKDLQAEFKAIGDVPQEDATALWKNFTAAVEHFYDQWKINKELRDYDFKKNLGEKQLILAETISLADEPDVITAFRRLQELHQKWRETGPVAKELRDSIWNDFRDASAVVSKRYQAFFEERKAREQQAEEKKTALCEQIEAIDWTKAKTFADWNALTALIIKAQEEWKTSGHAPRKSSNALFARFRQTCDKFFAAKAEYFKNVKDNLAENLARKTQLCEQAEALSESTDWRKTTDEILALKEQWKTIGPVPKKVSDQIWHRFLNACDTFFDRKKKINSARRKEETANLKTKRTILARLNELNADTETDRAAAVTEIQQLRQQWQQTGHVPMKEKDRLAEEYRTLMGQLFDRYDMRQTRARMAQFESDVAATAETRGGSNRLLRDRERLVRTYEQRRAELKTYENNLGFLNFSSKQGEAMLKEMQRKMQRLRDDIADLEKKIAIIDQTV